MEEQKEEKVWVAWNETNVGPWFAIQFREFNLTELENTLVNEQIFLEEQEKNHPDDCSWWQDWHSCSCGAFDQK